MFSSLARFGFSSSWVFQILLISFYLCVILLKVSLYCNGYVLSFRTNIFRFCFCSYPKITLTSGFLSKIKIFARWLLCHSPKDSISYYKTSPHLPFVWSYAFSLSLFQWCEFPGLQPCYPALALFHTAWVYRKRIINKGILERIYCKFGAKNAHSHTSWVPLENRRESNSLESDVERSIGL